jgi:hypothetical protein
MTLVDDIPLIKAETDDQCGSCLVSASLNQERLSHSRLCLATEAIRHCHGVSAKRRIRLSAARMWLWRAGSQQSLLQRHEHLDMIGDGPTKVQREPARMRHLLGRPAHDLLQHRFDSAALGRMPNRCNLTNEARPAQRVRLDQCARRFGFGHPSVFLLCLRGVPLGDDVKGSSPGRPAPALGRLRKVQLGALSKALPSRNRHPGLVRTQVLQLRKGSLRRVLGLHCQHCKPGRLTASIWVSL